jgi:hypothetical protein
MRGGARNTNVIDPRSWSCRPKIKGHLEIEGGGVFYLLSLHRGELQRSDHAAAAVGSGIIEVTGNFIVQIVPRSEAYFTPWLLV